MANSADDCERCLLYEVHESEDKENHNSFDCTICKEHATHQKAYREAREEYQNLSTRESFRSFTADMQKVILLPKLTSKEHIFVSRLVVFNETFASLDGHADLLILWHEGVEKLRLLPRHI